MSPARVALVRALAVDPRLLVRDVPFSALDRTVAAQVLDRRGWIGRERGLALLFIGQDLCARARWRLRAGAPSPITAPEGGAREVSASSAPRR